MQDLEGGLVLSASDLTGFAACGHLTQLELAVTRGEFERAQRDDPMLDVLSRLGGEHETKHLERYRAAGRTVAEIPGDLRTREALAQAERDTFHAMRAGADVIYQATFFDGRWRGHADFLLKVDTPSPHLGDWSYEVADTKLARRVKAGALLQMCHYSEHVARLQGTDPQHMHVITGDGEQHTEKVRDYAAYYRTLKKRFEAIINEATATNAATANTYPDPVDHCGVCRWGDVCKQQRRDDDHLSLVAKIRSDQTRKLEAVGIRTRTALANVEAGTNPSAVNDTTFAELRAQAKLQVESEGKQPRHYELLPPEPPPSHPNVELLQAFAADNAELPSWPKRGFAALPAPSEGDLFFDMEGDPYALDDGGLEYLFGVVESNGDYTPLWGHTRAEEKQAFEAFIDFVMARLAVHPDLHIYHYAKYEQTAVKRLMGIHGTREQEVDELLRGERFVDLYAVVRQGVRIGTESYSLKEVEHLYLTRDDTGIAGGGESIVAYEDWLEDHDPARLDGIQHYNREDCRSTLELRDWLEARRTEAVAQFGEIPRPDAKDGTASEEISERDAELTALADALTRHVPDDPTQRDDAQQARWLLAQLLFWHRREDKPDWWTFFHRISYETDGDFVDDRECIGGLELVGEVERVKQSTVYEYAFAPQDHKFREGAEPTDPNTGKRAGAIVGPVDDANGRLFLKRGPSLGDPSEVTSLIPAPPINSKLLEEGVGSVAREVIAHGIDGDGAFRAARDLLLRRPPRITGVTPGEPLTHDGESGKAAAHRIVPLLDHTCLAVQGPPGSGKTTVGADVIVELVRQGKRVGITAHSHSVIGNLLDAVCRTAGERGVEIAMMQKAEDHQRCASAQVQCVDSNDAVLDALTQGTVSVVGGTAWLWARPAMRDTVDVLFVDEAGQKSLADVIAMSGAAESIVLLGDPQQLAQPSHGSHPDGAEVSALEHVIGDHQTMPNELGLFLATSHRMHPSICAFISEIAYDNKLLPEPGNERQTVDGEAGLRWVPVEHTGNRSSSAEEAEVVAQLVDDLLAKMWTDREGDAHVMTLDDVLVVTPYNAQVAKLAAALPDGARVGTVDKFQGREAPVVIYSLATSSAEDVPRGMEFLYDLHRLNVAVSRAQGLCIVVATPALLEAHSRTATQLRLANSLCRFTELERS